MLIWQMFPETGLGDFAGRRGLFGNGCPSNGAGRLGSVEASTVVWGREIGMGGSTKIPGDRFRFPVLRLASASGSTSIPGEKETRHMKRVGKVFSKPPYSRRRIETVVLQPC